MRSTLKRWYVEALGRAALSLSGVSRSDKLTIERIRARNLTYLSSKKLASLVSTCRTIEDRRVPGIFVEAGCALGGSTILISSVKRDARPLWVYDVFGMIPAPTSDDTPEVHERYRVITTGASQGIGGDAYYGYQQDLYGTVKSHLREFGIDEERQHVVLVKGLVQETMKIEEQVAFAHIDVDWYDPVKTCLERIVPRMSLGGVIILDDYHDWGGCRKAVDEFFAHDDGRFVKDDRSGSMKITRAR